MQTLIIEAASNSCELRLPAGTRMTAVSVNSVATAFRLGFLTGDTRFVTISASFKSP